MKNKRKFFLIISIFFIMPVISSCTGGREIKELALVTAIGLDRNEEDIILTCEVSNPGYNPNIDGVSSASKSVVFIRGYGKTLREARENISLNFDRDLFFSHANVLILGEDLAKQGIIRNLDYLLRSEEPREDLKIVVAKGSKASEIMGVRGDLNLSVGTYISNLLDDFENNGKTINIGLAEYYRYYYEDNNEPVIGAVQVEEIKAMGSKADEEGPWKKVLNVGGGAITREGALIGYLTTDEMFGFNFIVNDIKGGVITFDTPEKLNKNSNRIGKEDKFTSLEILKSGTKNEVRVKDGNIHLDINVKLRTSLVEEEKAIDLDDEEVIKTLEEASSREVEKIISKTLDKGQKEFKQDNFSIGKGIHRKDHDLWKEISKDWDRIFPEMTYSVNVETNITKIGIINLPRNLIKER